MIFQKTTKDKLLRLFVISIGVFSVLTISCKKENSVVTENIVTSSQISNISETGAIGGGNIYNEGEPAISSRGICWDTEPMPTIKNNKTLNGTGVGSFVCQLTDLLPNTTYHVRAFASNTEETSYGNSVSFKTNDSDIPILKTSPISNISSTSGISGGIIIYEGKDNVMFRGVCWGTNNPPSVSDAKTIDGNGIGVFTSAISGLNVDSLYYVRAYATNSKGTAYGNLLYLKPYKTTVTDIDGNVYHTATIGDQLWTIENLKVTKYQNGEPIQNILINSSWDDAETGAYCDYDNNSINSDTYGRLYNWFAAGDTRNLAPIGWHVATYEDYLQLTNSLGGLHEAEENMKTGSFKALSGGLRNESGVFEQIGVFPYFWTSTEFHEGSNWAWYLSLDGGDSNIICLSKNNGFSVRCVRD